LKKEIGDKRSEIWLLGDSNPKNWYSRLETPLDPRHPARHSIWTPILDNTQDKVYRKGRYRIDSSFFYTRNAIEDPSQKPPSNRTEWNPFVDNEIARFGEVIRTFNPRFILSFGAFSFEFARRSMNEEPRRRYSYWGARKLGGEFRKRVTRFTMERVNVLPLLHVSIARGKFLKSHEYYCAEQGANYFDYVANFISELLLLHGDSLGVWI